MTAAATKSPAQAGEMTGTTARALLGRMRPHRNPWRHPWFLEGFTWLYLIWSLVPVALAVLFSFNNGKSQSVWQGFSWRWYFQDPVNSVLHDPALHAAVVQTIRLSVYVTLITVPLGVAFALGNQPLARPHGLDLQLRDDPVLRDPRADLRRRDVLRVHAAVQDR